MNGADAQLLRLQPWRALLALALDWALIAVCFAVAAYAAHPLVYGVVAVLIARSQLALGVMMHEAAHGLLTVNRTLNDRLGQWLAAGPLWLSLKTYRAGHLKHHRVPMQQDDPVARIFAIHDYPLPRGRLIRRLVAHACGVGYVVTLAKLLRGEFRYVLPTVEKSPACRVWELVSMLLSNGLMLVLLSHSGHPWLYPGLWLLPSITLLPLFGQVRAVFEHAGLPEADDQRQNARTIVRRSWQTFLFGPHSVHYHIEHHLFVRAPFYRLPAIHRWMAEHRQLPLNNLYPGYGAVLRDVTTRRGHEAATVARDLT